jgi:hypothetical protein
MYAPDLEREELLSVNPSVPGHKPDLSESHSIRDEDSTQSHAAMAHT